MKNIRKALPLRLVNGSTKALILACAVGLGLANDLPALTLGYWSFADGAMLTDSSGNGNSLTLNGTDIDSYALPASGVGSSFPSSLLGGVNTHAIRGNGTGSSFSTSSLSASTAFTTTLNATTAFTLEAFINLENSAGGTKSIMGLGGGQTNGAWTFGVASDGSGLGARSLFFQYARVGGSWGANQLVNLNSSFSIEVGKDYYVALALNTTDASSDGAVFYIQNLTDGGALQTIKVSRTSAQAVEIFDTSSSLTIGNSITTTGWNGTLDDIRISNTQLSQGELLISSIPEPASIGLIMGGMALMPLLRRRRRSSERMRCAQ